METKRDGSFEASRLGDYSMNKSMFRMVAGVFISVLVFGGGPAWSESQAGVHFEVKSVMVLPHLGDRYQTMRSLPDSDYQIWQLDIGGSIAQQVVAIPKQPGTKWVEMLIVARNDSRRMERIHFNSPQLNLADGGHATPWEFAFAGMGSHDGLVKALQLSATPPLRRVLHVAVAGDLSCDLGSMQETWMVLVFQVPNSAQDATFSMDKNKADPIRFPLSDWSLTSEPVETSRAGSSE